MGRRALVLGWSRCPVGGSSGKSIRVLVALVAAMICVGWPSSVVAEQVWCLTDDSYCRDVGFRCTYNGPEEQRDCCLYTCVPDESCTEEELQPANECAPPDVDVHVNIYSGAPGCGGNEGQTTVDNQSYFYYYRFSASTTGDSGIWSCELCHVTESVENATIAPKGQPGHTYYQGISFPSGACSGSCPAYVEGGCCDNCPSDYSEEPECANHYCDFQHPSHQACASVSPEVQFVAWSANGTLWRPYSPHRTVDVNRSTSQCDE